MRRPVRRWRSPLECRTFWRVPIWRVTKPTSTSSRAVFAPKFRAWPCTGITIPAIVVPARTSSTIGVRLLRRLCPLPVSNSDRKSTAFIRSPCRRARVHDLAQHRLSHSRCMAGLAIPENGRPRHVAHDEHAGCNGAHPLEPSIGQRLPRQFRCRFPSNSLVARSDRVFQCF
jgi:hypothetical protein